MLKNFVIIITTIFVTVSYLTQLSHASCQVPPSFWCLNPILSEQCNVKDQCSQYNKASQNRSISVTLLYEAFCPGCQNFIETILYPELYEQLSDIVHIELVPYGNARSGQNGSIICQHGPGECEANKFESCAIHYLQKQKSIVPFIHCLEGKIAQKQTLQTASNACYQQLETPSVLRRKIKSCYLGRFGNELQLRAANRTKNVYPTGHKFVPWILIQNVSLLKIQDYAAMLPQLVCLLYNGSPLPYYCKEAVQKGNSKSGYKSDVGFSMMNDDIHGRKLWPLIQKVE